MTIQGDPDRPSHFLHADLFSQTASPTFDLGQERLNLRGLSYRSGLIQADARTDVVLEEQQWAAEARHRGSSIWGWSMGRGTVKWFNPSKGYGFIQPQGGGKDIFVHIFAVERSGLSTLNEGQQIEYEIVEDRGKTSAVKLKSSDPPSSVGRSLR